MNNKHVAITGGMGFIGHHLALNYLDQGFRVTVIDNLEFHRSHAALTKQRMELLDHNKLEFIQLDCGLSYSIGDRLRGANSPRSIIHLASYPNQAAVKAETYTATSRMGSDTYNLAKLSKEIEARFVLASSSMVYGNFIDVPQKEASELNPINMYGLLKMHCEHIAKMTHGNTVIVRPSAVYGPRDNAKRVLAKWLLAAVRGEPIYVDDPSSLLDFTFVEDTATGIALAEEHGTAGHAYNITRGQGRSLGEAAHIIKSLIGSKSEIIYENDMDLSMPKRGALDISKAMTHLGYQPRVDLHKGLERYARWMLDNHDLFREDI
jgi:UDP-glucose 4-epimerase